VTPKSLAAAALVALASVALVSPPARADEQHAAPATSVGPNDELRKFVPGAAALEGKILAPCCWNQTVDIHGSEISNAIRREIRTRLRAGESADVIQASFVERYGPKILAMPADSPLSSIALTVLVVIGVAGVAGFFMLKRWRLAGAAPIPKTKRDEASDTRLDARLDAELKALDD
jgi:cytochrome c-type biogenesis protein CcmH